MYEPVQQCTHCGANLSLDDLRKPNCGYCGTVFPHHAQAAQHAEMAGQMMSQMMAQQAAIQQQWRAGFGLGPMPQGMPVGPPPGMAPPPGMVPPPGMPGSPYGDPARLIGAQMEMARRTSRNIVIIVAVALIGSMVLAGVIAAVVLFA